MTELSEQDIQRIAEMMAPLVVAQVKMLHHEFWIDAEVHYNSHKDLEKLFTVFNPDMIASLKVVAESYKKGRNIFWGIFLTMVSIGALIMAFNAYVHDNTPK